MADSCAGVEPLLSALLDGELDDAEVGRVTAHLEGCEDCGQVLTGLAEVARVLGNAPPRRAPASLVGTRLPAGDAALRPLVRRAQALAVATGLLVGVVFALGGAEPEERHVPKPLDVFVADHFGQVMRGQVTTPILLGPDTGPESMPLQR